MDYYPKLIENLAKNYLFQTLKQCHNNRVTIYYYIFNISIFVIFGGREKRKKRKSKK